MNTRTHGKTLRRMTDAVDEGTVSVTYRRPMVAGLTRIGHAFRQIAEQGKGRALGHASAGPCLQQNLVCVLEAE